MVKHFGALGLAAMIAVLASCASPPAGSPALSPREKALQVDQSYALVQTAVLTAVQTPGLSADVKTKLDAGSKAATVAVLAYSQQADNCFRDPATGVVGNAPGKTCDQTALGNATGIAWAEIGQVNGLLAAFAPSLAVKLPAPPAN